MLRLFFAALAFLATTVALFATSFATYAANPQVEIKTDMGTIIVELYPDKAPETVANFLQYVKKGQYNGTIFHRVKPGFMIQGGGFTPDFKEKPTGKPVKNEAANGLHNGVGTIAMARTPDPHSATAQFFINVAENAMLDFRFPTEDGYGYAVFGKVVKGMDVVTAIEKVRTGPGPAPHQDVPVKPVVIESIKVVGATGKPATTKKK